MTQHIEFGTYFRPETGMTADDLRAWAKTEIARVQRDLEKIGQCKHCMNFDNGHCVRWGAPVPADVQPTGCADWCIDVVPF